MTFQTPLNQAWLERHIEDCIEFADPKSGLTDSPHSLTCMLLGGYTMSMFTRAKAKRALLSDMVLLALVTNKRWLMDNRYAVYPQVLERWTSIFDLRNLPEDKITVFGVDSYPHLSDECRSVDSKTQVTNYRDAHASHGGLYYIGRNLVDQDERSIQAYLADMNFVNYPVSYARYPYPVRVLRHLTYDFPILPWWNEHEPYADVQVITTEDDIFSSHKKILNSNTTEVPTLIVDSDFVPHRSPWMFPRVSIFEEQYVNLFQTFNPLNGLVYGHGGPKLIRNSTDQMVAEGQENNHSKALADLDMTSFFAASKGMKLQSVVGTHNFCWSDFSTWRTAFREAFKLTRLLNGDLADHHQDQARHRLHTWMGLRSDDLFSYESHVNLFYPYETHLSREDFVRRSELARTGAHMGSAFASADRKTQPNVNNYEELKDIFSKAYKNHKL